LDVRPLVAVNTVCNTKCNKHKTAKFASNYAQAINVNFYILCFVITVVSAQGGGGGGGGAGADGGGDETYVSESYAWNWKWTVGFVVPFGAVMLCCCFNMFCEARNYEKPRKGAQDYLMDWFGPRNQIAKQVDLRMWNGHYVQYNQEQKMNITVNYDPNDQNEFPLTGIGSDPLGTFRIFGYISEPYCEDEEKNPILKCGFFKEYCTGDGRSMQYPLDQWFLIYTGVVTNWNRMEIRGTWQFPSKMQLGTIYQGDFVLNCGPSFDEVFGNASEVENNSISEQQIPPPTEIIMFQNE
jgi:hypothetical protein